MKRFCKCGHSPDVHRLHTVKEIKCDPDRRCSGFYHFDFGGGRRHRCRPERKIRLNCLADGCSCPEPRPESNKEREERLNSTARGHGVRIRSKT